jgi:hypothetical protein
VDFLGQAIPGDPHWFEELLEQQLARAHRAQFCDDAFLLSVVIDDFHVASSRRSPTETNSKLIIDPDTMLARRKKR